VNDVFAKETDIGGTCIYSILALTLSLT